MEKVIPPVASPAQRAARKPAFSAVGARRRVAFFLGCLSDIVFFREPTEHNRPCSPGWVAMLSFPRARAAAAPAVHGHAGEHTMAVEQAKRNIAAFEGGRLRASY